MVKWIARKFLFYVGCFAWSLFAVLPVEAQSKIIETSLSGAFNVAGFTEQPVLFVADSLSYKNDGEIVEAKGNVEIRQAGRVINADRLVFNRTTEEILASGNVTIQDKLGNKLRTDKVALDRTFSRGFMEQVQLALTPDIQFAANYSERSGGDRLALYKSVFSPCPACEEDPSKERLWQLKAGEIVLDEKRRQVSYRNITFEVRGVPVLYLPFFAHPDPRVERQTGFLMPSVKSGNGLGVGLTTPYFFDLGESADVTVSPTIFLGLVDEAGGNGGPGGGNLDVDFRQALPGGEFRFEGFSSLELKGTYFDNSLFGAGDAPLNSAVRVSFASDIGKLSRIKGDFAGWTDREYFNEFGIDTEEYDDRNLKFESFSQRSYASFTARDQFVLRNSLEAVGNTMPDTGETLISYISEPFLGAATIGVDLESVGLYREAGRDYARVSSTANVRVPFTSSFGLKTTFEVGGFGVFYDIHQANDQDSLDTSSQGFDGNAVRFHPAASVRLELPLASTNGSFDQVLEPIFQAVYAGNQRDVDFAPNEDSVDLALDEGNIFNLWRTNGIDKLDRGSRIDYGMRYSLHNDSDSWLRVFVGQSLKLEESNTTWDDGSGLENDLSHLIGSVTYDPGTVLDATWRFGYDVEANELYSNDLAIGLKTDKASLKASYETGLSGTGVENLRRLNVNASIEPFDFLSSNFNYKKNFLEQDGEEYSAKLKLSLNDRLTFTTGYGYENLTNGNEKTFSGGISYVHPCLNFTFTGERKILASGDTDDNFGFALGLKYLADSSDLNSN